MKVSSFRKDLAIGTALWHRYGEEQRPAIHFSAANGFPLRSYAFLLRHFDADAGLFGLENPGMWSNCPQPIDSMSWHDYADDLITFLESVGVSALAPIIGVGHSIGGAVTLLAACKRPELFSKLVFIDMATQPAALETPQSNNTHLALKAQADKMVDYLVSSTLKKPTQWSSQKQFLHYLNSRSVYQGFTDEALNDYVRYGLIVDEAGSYHLRYSTRWEAHNFGTTPDLQKQLSTVSVPTLFMYGEDSFLYPPEKIALLRQQFSPTISLKAIAGGGHLVVQEQPQLVFSALQQWLGL